MEDKEDPVGYQIHRMKMTVVFELKEKIIERTTQDKNSRKPKKWWKIEVKNKVKESKRRM